MSTGCLGSSKCPERKRKLTNKEGRRKEGRPPDCCPLHVKEVGLAGSEVSKAIWRGEGIGGGRPVEHLL